MSNRTWLVGSINFHSKSLPTTCRSECMCTPLKMHLMRIAKSGSGRQWRRSGTSFTNRLAGPWSRRRGTTAQQQKGPFLGNLDPMVAAERQPHTRAITARTDLSRRVRQSRRARHDHGMHGAVTAHAADMACALPLRRAHFGHGALYGHDMIISVAARIPRHRRRYDTDRAGGLNS
jgi:hypothetical protein